jgi:hypothetical protein
MLDLLWRVRFRRKLHPRQVTGDTTYGTVENIVAVEDAGIRAYVPLPDMNHRRPFYGQDEFPYDATHDAYSCPAGHALRRERIKQHRGRHRLPGRCHDLQCLSAQGELHRKPPRPAPPSLARRGVPGMSTPPRRTSRPCASAKSGSSPGSRRRRSGMAYVASGDGGLRTSTSRDYWSRRARTSSAGWARWGGDDATPHAGASWLCQGGHEG